MQDMTLDKQRVLLTGAAGFVGFHLANRLLDAGAIVHGFDNVSDYYDVNLKEARLAALAVRERFSFVRADVADHAQVRAAFSEFQPDYVIHLAAQSGVRYSLINPTAYLRSNIDGFLEILEACRAHPIRHLVFASSSSVYGASTRVPYVETDRSDRPVSLYGATKRSNELMAHSYAHLYAIPCTGLRLFTVYGPWGRPDMAPFLFTKAILEGRPIDIFNHGKARRDFTYVDDITEAIARLVQRPPDAAAPQDLGDGEPASGRYAIFNVGNHTSIEVDQLIAAIENALGCKAIRRHLPPQPGDLTVTFADVARLAKAVEFAPSTPLDIGIGRFVEWYRGFYRV